MSHSLSEPVAESSATPEPSPRVVITTLGVTQILAWGSSYYLPAVLAKPIAADTGWSLAWVLGGLSAGLLAAGLISPKIGRTIDAKGAARSSPPARSCWDRDWRRWRSPTASPSISWRGC